MTARLPHPAARRWQPLRAGLVDLFYYDQEEFWFRDGRLLLRGNNGTGKSKVLALTLPFLLDGDLSPHRVEPDADSKKRMDWNLLLGGDHPYPERLGYTWLEFGRVDEHGEEHYRTLGCGLKAVAGRGITRHWFFLTRRRIGADLGLVDSTGTALTRDRLVDALGDLGAVHDRARDYRRAVDENLFGFGEQRYTALVDLLIQLRQPQLSKRPSEKALSDALTEALPPLDQAVVADVAEAFRSIEEDRDALTMMAEARDAARSFLTQYRRYARIAARRRATLPRNAQSAYERINRDLGAAETDLTDADTRLGAARERREVLAEQRIQLQARDDALRASPEMRSARELENAAEQARRLGDEARRLEGDHGSAAEHLRRQTERCERATARLGVLRGRLTDVRATVTDEATRSRIAVDHARRVDALLDGDPDVAAIRREAERLAERQHQAVSALSVLLGDAERASRDVATARRRLSDVDAEVDHLAERCDDATAVARGQGSDLVSKVRQHLERSQELALPDPAATLAELELWVETLQGTNPAVTAVTAAGQAAASRLATADAGLLARQRAGEESLAQVDAEIARLERGEDGVPPAPHTRAPEIRSGRPGAPLWRLVDFADDVGPADRAGLEAALEAAGVLDAWVTPAGEVLAPGTDDVVLRAGARTPANLSAVLRPSIDPADAAAGVVSRDTVDAVLAGIALGELGDVRVTPDGRFRLGVLEGAWHKPAATYIGRTAREAARRARLVALRAERVEVVGLLTTIAAERDLLARRVRALTTETASLPPDETLRGAHARVLALAEEGRRLTERRARAADDLATVTTAEHETRAAVDEAARDADLPPYRGALDEVAVALNRYRVCLATLWPAIDSAAEGARAAEDAAEEVERATDALETSTARVTVAHREAAAAEERRHTLSSTVGAAVAELQRRLSEVSHLLRANTTATESAALEAEEAIAARGRADGRREQLAGQLDGAAAERTAAAESFRRFAATGLLAVALPELELPDAATPWAPDPTVRLARRVNDGLTDVPDDDPAWDRAQQRVNNELKVLHDTLSRHGNRASADLREDGVVVQVEFRGRPASVPDLVAALTTEVADRERLLNERERETLENHLVNEVASTLQELISASEAQVAAMNAELESRPTSTGMRLRLLWRPRDDGPAGLTQARERLLRQTADAWSEDDRAAVGGFLQARIAEVRARDTGGTWLEHLTEALDYRAWNRFVIQRHQNGQWRPATGPASGGERVLAASVPLFAAASAHYASAGNPHAPRLVTLDEAFAGVDDNARAKYLGLLAAFDLDVVMTSEREWGCYPEVPGLAISQLSRTDGVAAVLVTNWEWDGARRHRVDRPVEILPGPRAAGREGDGPGAVEPQDGLWG